MTPKSNLVRAGVFLNMASRGHPNWKWAAKNCVQKVCPTKNDVIGRLRLVTEEYLFEYLPL